MRDSFYSWVSLIKLVDCLINAIRNKCCGCLLFIVGTISTTYDVTFSEEKRGRIHLLNVHATYDDTGMVLEIC